ncbi:uncharacterized protein LOC120449182 isoform X1 [Drosophila santomea]|uniref:uncharacterized protein LOC120449182 isoform X1 n=1 Tax=Drosophila santomea TaxID=129105 RepID=UPI001953CD9B|nr:uncharacterized protein LOC120449182 isoform X1 [Drosophila santomea]XP_039487463.1 uncharacterized protein LOC120449182 isoform X1 [Drosophila santomea]XP_039487464.1 uncharacterized protein LOC120449182 isoform X1 [Drosophila santomea]
MRSYWKDLWRVLDSLTDPPKRSEDNVLMTVSRSRLSLLTQISLRSEPRGPRFVIPSTSRHVSFSPSTLEHLETREAVRQAETSAFQNFVREMYEGYYQLLLSQERELHGFRPEQQLANRRLGLKDLVRLQRVASDLWKRMDRQRKQQYKDLAMMALHRRYLRLPPDPHRLPPHLKGFKKLRNYRSCLYP